MNQSTIQIYLSKLKKERNPLKLALFKLYFIRGASMREIALISNTCVSTISRRLKRIAKELTNDIKHKSSWKK